MQVVLLGVHAEITQTGRDRVLTIGDLDRVVDDVAGVGDPLPADHELVLGAAAEGVGHPPVPAGNSGPAGNGVEQTAELLLADLALRPDRHDEIGLPQQVRIEIDVECLANGHLEAIVPQDTGEERRALVRLMPLPAARDQQCPFRTIRHVASCLPYLSAVSSAERCIRRNHHARVGWTATAASLAVRPAIR